MESFEVSQRARPSSLYPDNMLEDEIFVPSSMSWAVASAWIREFADLQFRERCYFLGVQPSMSDRAPVLINTSIMLRTWGDCKRQGYTGVYFRIGYDKEIHASAI